MCFNLKGRTPHATQMTQLYKEALIRTANVSDRSTQIAMDDPQLHFITDRRHDGQGANWGCREGRIITNQTVLSLRKLPRNGPETRDMKTV